MSLPPEFWSLLTMLGSALAFLVIFSVIVLVHEWGHFTAARIFGVRVEEFGLGLPPKARKLWKRGDTEYTLNWLPLGGFVRLYGEGDSEGKLAKDHDSFSSKPVWQRIVIAGAGVFMNFVLAFILLFVFFLIGGRPMAIIPDNLYPFSVPSYLITTESQARQTGLFVPDPEIASKGPLVAAVMEGSPAAQAGIKPGMHITTLNNTPAKDTQTLVESLATIPKNTPLQLQADTNTVTLQKTGDKLGIVFAAPFQLSGYNFSVTESLQASAQELGVQTTLLLQSLGTIGKQVTERGTIPEEIGGPVKIAEAVHMANQLGLDALLAMSILLSVNLGVLNILPIPALDGGRIFFLLIEGITRRRIKPLWEARAHISGYLILMLLMVVITGRDILQLFTR